MKLFLELHPRISKTYLRTHVIYVDKMHDLNSKERIVQMLENFKKEWWHHSFKTQFNVDANPVDHSIFLLKVFKGQITTTLLFLFFCSFLLNQRRKVLYLIFFYFLTYDFMGKVLTSWKSSVWLRKDNAAQGWEAIKVSFLTSIRILVWCNQWNVSLSFGAYEKEFRKQYKIFQLQSYILWPLWARNSDYNI